MNFTDRPHKALDVSQSLFSGWNYRAHTHYGRTWAAWKVGHSWGELSSECSKDQCSEATSVVTSTVKRNKIKSNTNKKNYSLNLESTDITQKLLDTYYSTLCYLSWIQLIPTSRNGICNPLWKSEHYTIQQHEMDWRWSSVVTQLPQCNKRIKLIQQKAVKMRLAAGLWLFISRLAFSTKMQKTFPRAQGGIFKCPAFFEQQS